MKKLLSFAFLISAFFSKAQGTWTTLANLPPHSNGGVALLLSNGKVMVKTNAGGGDGIGNIWNILSPDANGSYINGTWSVTSPMNFTRLYFSSQVLKDGKVYVVGGEYGSGYGNIAGEVYDPLTNTWSLTPLPGNTVSDANSEILPDGKVLQACVAGNLKITKIYDPVANTYTPGPSSIGIHNESAWVKLPDNSILMVDRNSTASERYIPSLNTWTADATVPVQLYDPYGLETGSALLLPDGRAWFIGSGGRTAYYTPSGNNSPGSWVAGPNVPSNRGTPDAMTAMMVDGKIMCVVSPTPVSGNVFQSPSYFYEFDYTNNTYSLMNMPAGNGYTNQPCYVYNFLNLPDGKVLVSRQDTNIYFVYTPAGLPLAAGQPTINNIMQNGCNNFTITGKQFNGISQGQCYGDDWQNATNYPIVRLTQGANVWYARTSNWNSTGVRRGNAADTAWFTTPNGLPPGTFSLVVIANGIASQSVAFTPVPSLTTNVSPPALCSGNNFSYTPGADIPGVSFNWTRPAVSGITNTAIITPQNTNPNEVLNSTLTLPANVIYQYTLSINNCSVSPQVTVSVLPTPIFTVSSSPTICPGVSTTLTAGVAPTFTWSNGVQNASIVVSPTVSQTYSVSSTNSYVCSSTQTVFVNVLPGPTLSVTGPTLICRGDVVTLQANGATTFTWDNGSNTPTISVNPSVTITYTLYGSLSNGCKDSIQFVQTVDPCIGLKEMNLSDTKILVHPNPSDGKFYIEDPGAMISSVFLYDVTGKEISSDLLSENGSVSVDLSYLPEGIYYLKVEKPNGAIQIVKVVLIKN